MRTCLECNAEIPPHKRADAKFCSDSCKSRYQLAMKKRPSLSDTTQITPSVNPIRSLTPVVAPVARAISPQLGDSAVGMFKSFDTLSRPQLAFGLGGAFVGALVVNKLVKKPRTSDYLLGFAAGYVGSLLLQYIVSPRENEQQYQEQYTQPSHVGLSDRPHYMSVSQALETYTPKVIVPYRLFQFVAPNGADNRFRMVVHGRAGSGKSTYVTAQIAEFQRVGRVLYVLTEETITDSVKNRLRRFGLTDAVTILEPKDVREVYTALGSGQFQFAVIDSLTVLLPDVMEQHRFFSHLRQFDLLGSLVIVQETKGNQAKGRNEVLHDADIVVQVDSLTIEVEKTRFGASDRKLKLFENDSNVHQLPVSASAPVVMNGWQSSLK